MRNKEYNVYKAITSYLLHQYPKVLFRYDQAGYNLSKAQAGKNKAIQMPNFKYPDLFIAKPNKQFGGLYIEIKATNDDLYLKDGKTYKADKHIKCQYKAILLLISEGYYASFAVGFDQAKLIIDNYMKID